MASKGRTKALGKSCSVFHKDDAGQPGEIVGRTVGNHDSVKRVKNAHRILETYEVFSAWEEQFEKPTPDDAQGRYERALLK